MIAETSEIPSRLLRMDIEDGTLEKRFSVVTTASTGGNVHGRYVQQHGE